MRSVARGVSGGVVDPGDPHFSEEGPLTDTELRRTLTHHYVNSSWVNKDLRGGCIPQLQKFLTMSAEDKFSNKKRCDINNDGQNISFWTCRRHGAEAAELSRCYVQDLQESFQELDI
ncbi:hypothetical protein EVAR_61881_1 [Eumeta japonica]|uniref:Uncharacterized protein n=1 Tax=Eumeta variegata TaxID=151549 RepID=A0A4C1YYI8_EUMVA|nr:hypothetical protein EVAR_61881_1 [Eumeta japonica]